MPPLPTDPLKPATSRQIDALRFVLAVAIVIIHARGYTESIGGEAVGPATLGRTASFLQELLSGVVARTAVPLFFLFSGFLIAGSLQRHGYREVLKRRCRTLLVPFLIWNLLAFASYRAANPDHFAGSTALDFWGVTAAPAAYHFWFVRDLIVLVALSPLFSWAARVTPLAAIAAASTLWFVAPPWLGAGGAPVDPAAICFFLIGCALRLQRVDVSSAKLQLAVFAYLPLAVADAAFENASPAGFAFHKAVLLLGMVAVWVSATRLLGKHPLPGALTGSAFLVFAAHEPLLSALKKLSYALLRPGGDVSVTAIYLLAATLTVAACVTGNLFLSKHLPRTHALITGGRTLPIAT